jgi:cell wall-associated NlpC family hydrolase
MLFAPEVDAAARDHAISEFPKESCGIVVGGAYLPIKNIAPTPERDFRMADDTWAAHVVEGVIHSHGQQEALAPSANDMVHQISSNVPWGITQTDGVAASPVLWWGDFRLDEPLLGRQFVHGVTDCYSAIRSWRWQNTGIKLPDFPRNDQWWMADEDLYNDGFPRAGYRVITEYEASVGDVALINFRSKVPNHGGTLVEDGLLYHHLQNRLSCREPVGRWRPMISKWLRYEG